MPVMWFFADMMSTVKLKRRIRLPKINDEDVELYSVELNAGDTFTLSAITKDGDWLIVGKGCDEFFVEKRLIENFTEPEISGIPISNSKWSGVKYASDKS